MAGDLPGAAASFDTAEALLSSSDHEAEPASIHWFTVADPHGIAGESYLSASEPGAAIEHLNQAIEECGEEFARDRAMWLSTIATAQVRNGDLEEGLRNAE